MADVKKKSSREEKKVKKAVEDEHEDAKEEENEEEEEEEVKEKKKVKSKKSSKAGDVEETVVSRGKSAHSSMPKEGINSITNINEFVTRANAEMQEVTDKYKNDILGETAHSITIINGGDQVNSIPTITTLQGNIRTIPEFDNSKVKALLQSIIKDLNKKEGFNLELIVDYDIYPVESKSDSKLIKTMLDAIDQKLPVTGISPTTDAAAFTKADNEFDVVIYGPGVSDLPHQVDEYVSIENYLEMIDNYKAIFKEYLK
jgi:succinyl-diaminopimelate desuccinylase